MTGVDPIDAILAAIPLEAHFNETETRNAARLLAACCAVLDPDNVYPFEVKGLDEPLGRPADKWMGTIADAILDADIRPEHRDLIYGAFRMAEKTVLDRDGHEQHPSIGDDEALWQQGRIQPGDLRYMAKLHADKDAPGLEGGPIEKLAVFDEQGVEIVSYADGIWEKQPADETRERAILDSLVRFYAGEQNRTRAPFNPMRYYGPTGETPAQFFVQPWTGRSHDRAVVDRQTDGHQSADPEPWDRTWYKHLILNNVLSQLESPTRADGSPDPDGLTRAEAREVLQLALATLDSEKALSFAQDQEAEPQEPDPSHDLDEGR